MKQNNYYMAKHNEIGKYGENVTKTFLMKHNFCILDTNYRLKYGEIDIIAEKDNIIHFVEVKTVEVFDFLKINSLKIKPEDNLTKNKWSKLVISCETYLYQKNIKEESRWQIDLACVYLNHKIRQAKVVLIENINKN